MPGETQDLRRYVDRLPLDESTLRIVGELKKAAKLSPSTPPWISRIETIIVISLWPSSV